MQTNTVSNAASTATAAAATTSKKSVINSDFDTFLKMLTTQIKNQDPTNPMDSADFAVQLATFSGVEQQVKTNDMLSTLSSQFGVMGMSQLAAWVGQEARAPGPVYLGDAAVSVTYASATGADRAVLVARDSEGAVVGREDVPLGKGPYDWTGNDIKGNALPNGKYTLTLESYKGEDKLGDPTEVEAYSRILEARSGASGTVLVLEGGIEVAATQVTALRVAGTAGTGELQKTTAPSTQSIDAAVETTQAADIWADSSAANTASDQVTQPEPETYKPD